MTGQQYRVIADRTKGDRIDTEPWEEGDRLIYTVGKRTNSAWPRDDRTLVRIERPVPTTDEHDGHTVTVGPLLNDPFAPHPPTREQIAEAITEGIDQDVRLLMLAPTLTLDAFNEHLPRVLDALSKRAASAAFALIQNGAE